ncbi:hypothetical protein F7725_021617 [Dissostichus mawsoni]|uniref:Thyroid transcription factor 1-associated protein 26 homolog n=1 Tax=Dissostichus mawsoni TaxID=36200 RepID=A0A7J5ZFT4_DISMA|nr:hypothetical protein F7725_021617 [Dissostichus mawsoni]
MAPTDYKKKDNKFVAKAGNWKKPQNTLHGVKKRKWVPDNKVFEGSVKEGQGFALKRKEKVKHEYNKLLRKEKRRTPASKALYKEEYPEHLRHLYVAEAEKLRNEAWTHRLNRTKQRLRKEETAEDDAPAEAEAAEPVPEDAEFLTDKQQRDEAIKKYKQKKEETFQILSKKTKKGQPNLNLQMEYLLQKITQGTGK